MSASETTPPTITTAKTAWIVMRTVESTVLRSFTEGSYAGGAEDSVTLAVWWLPDESIQLTSTLSFG